MAYSLEKVGEKGFKIFRRRRKILNSFASSPFASHTRKDLNFTTKKHGLEQ